MREQSALRTGFSAALVAALVATIASLTIPAADAVDRWVTVDGRSRELTGINIYRSADALVRYTPAHGATTRTNKHGFEAAVVKGKVSKVQDGVGNMPIPANGYVLSGNGTARTWLRANSFVGANVALSSTEPPPTVTAELPDVVIRTLGQFDIWNMAGLKVLKFPVVTANIGKGPLEIRANRSSSTSTDWVGHQVVYNSDGTTSALPPASATFYFAEDGHSHWHIRDFDLYQLFSSDGTTLRVGEKHGFCFEDNTYYRDWVGSPKHPEVPTSPVYTHEASCGEGRPEATSIVHGLSVGWGDTYQVTLPHQGMNITGIPDGAYTVKVTADWQDFWEETNESNNSATAQIRIDGNTVTLVSANDGL